MLDALEQAIHQRQPGPGLVHHSDRGSQYLSIKYTERPTEAGIEPSVGSVGDSYDNALAETINGLFKAEVIHRGFRSRHIPRYLIVGSSLFGKRATLKRRFRQTTAID